VVAACTRCTASTTAPRLTTTLIASTVTCREEPTLPELPEVEAWRRQLDPLVSESRVEHAGPAHVATLKTIDPPLSALDGSSLRVERRAKRFLLPTTDGELVLMVHLMSAGRLKHVAPGAKGAKAPMFRLRFEDGGELQLTEAGSKKRAGVWLLTPEHAAAELAHLGPEADELDADSLAAILASDSRRLHSLLRDQRLIAGIGRAWANEILWSAELSPYQLSTQVSHDETARLATAIRDELARGLELRLQGANDAKTYRIHNALAQPCPRCGTPIARVDFEEHTIYYCPTCQTGGRVLKDRRMSRLLR
jgi:formamidopyrimidine-DNA glycosylase